jgi:hypothetical protein
MIADSPTLIALVLGLGFIALAGFLYCIFRGWLDSHRGAADVVFDEIDLRTFRPWETSDQLAARRESNGKLSPPAPGEWGGAA